MLNQFDALSAENETSHFAQMSTLETAEANSYFDSLQAKQDEQEEIVDSSTINQENWTLFYLIHEEIDNGQVIRDMRHQDELLESLC